MSYAPPGTSPSKIWSYIKRGLTVLTLYEGVTNSKIIYRNKEFFNEGWQLIGKMLGTGKGGIYSSDDDLLNNALQTILFSGYDPTPIRDHDDTTADSIELSVLANTLTSYDIVHYDLGRVYNNLFIFIRYNGYYNLSGTLTVKAYIDVSQDGSTWNNVSYSPGTTASNVLVVTSNVRYIRYYLKVTYNTATSTQTFTHAYLYSLEVYEPQTLSIDINKEFNQLKYDTISVLFDGSSNIYVQLYKVRPI